MGARARAAVLAVLGVALSACGSMGGRVDYAHTTAVLSQQGKGRIAVATQDRRPYVISGKNDEKFVGVARGGVWNAFDASTKSDTPLATEMSNSLMATMMQAGYEPRKIVVPPGDAASAREVLGGTSHKTVFLVLNEWRSDVGAQYLPNVGGNTTIHYDVTLSVMKSGKVLASQSAKGKEGLGNGGLSSIGHAAEVLPQFFKAQLERLLNDPAIARALK